MSARERPSDDLGHLADEVVARSRLRGGRRARLADDLHEYLEDAALAGRSSASIAATFGDPAFVAALVRRSPPPARFGRHVRRLVAACVILAAGSYGMSAARLGTFGPEPDVALSLISPGDEGRVAPIPAPVLRTRFHRAARGAPGDADSLARALRIARAMKGVHTRSVGARLLEPLYFVRASSVDDVWAATRAVSAD